MKPLDGIWEGTLDGTNWGKAIAKFECDGGTLSGVIQISDMGIGTYNLGITGTQDGDRLDILLDQPNQLGRPGIGIGDA